MNRRRFLERSSLIGVALARGVSGEMAEDPAASPPVQWALAELRDALKIRGQANRRIITRAMAGPPESLAIGMENDALVASGSDARGLIYALLELADRVRLTGQTSVSAPVTEHRANAVRSIARCFESDVEDKSWFHDRDMWRSYLTMLATHRFNRFSLTLGLGYNAPTHVTDAYFYFPYPFLLETPGYQVRAVGLADAERVRNLATLQFIAAETVARGLEFQLGLWTHAYRWIDSPNPNYTISGLTPDNHAAYCRDALAALLKACPQVSGLTFRIHGESGIPEGSYGFWQTLFEGVARAGRPIEIDMHAKGIDQKTIDIGLATGMPVKVSPKFWAEHFGMPYHQASIRELEMPPREAVTSGPYTLSNGSRRFLRYGYGDLLTRGRKYGILHRIWPGTQRFLLWGDPVFAAGYGRIFSFCGSDGVELMEPLSFKGRIGSGQPGGRCAYADASLATKYDWEKYLYQYRVWGRLIYNPEASPESWRRATRAEYGAAAAAAESALASASRVLPIVTTTHGASGSNNTYWPEIYTNMPIVEAGRPQPYRDTPPPPVFGNVSSFDPELFLRIDDFAGELLAGSPSAKYSPLEVAQWLEDLADATDRQLSQIGRADPAAVRRLTIDAAIQSALGRFFAFKMRSAVLWSIFRRTGDPQAREEALKTYRAARQVWADLAAKGKVYVSDIAYGPQPHLRGHWLDRLPAIDQDIADMEKAQPQATGRNAAGAIAVVRARPQRPAPGCRHTPAKTFRPGEPMEVALTFARESDRSVVLHYRRVDQAESWRKTQMQPRAGAYRAAIDADYTRSPYPLQYYFEIGESQARTIYPGFAPDLANVPYFVVESA
jgi:hypothetical protein